VTGALARFVAALRDEGLAASPAEAVDAARALAAVGVEDRERVRSALRATLAKTLRGRATFDVVFDRFFAAPSTATRRGRGDRTGSVAEGAGRNAPVAAAPDRPGRERWPEPASASTEDGGAREIADRIADARDRPDRRRGRLRAVRLEEGEAAGPHARGTAGTDPSRADLDRRPADALERALAREVSRWIRRLRVRHGRRLAASRRGRLWTARMFRRAAGTDGAPFVLPFRRRRPNRPRVELLVDVSWSTATAAGYFLWLASEFVPLGRRVRVTAFVNAPVDITDSVRRWRPDRERFHALLARIDAIDPTAASDYGRTFWRFARSPFRPRGRNTVLVVLGDGRVNRNDPQAWAFESVASACRAVIWLVPEPRARWGTGDSALASYLPGVDVLVEARDLRGIVRGVESLLGAMR